jgi:hypothetical protein
VVHTNVPEIYVQLIKMFLHLDRGGAGRMEDPDQVIMATIVVHTPEINYLRIFCKFTLSKIYISPSVILVLDPLMVFR